MNSASCCAFHEKLTAFTIPLPASATNTCTRSTNIRFWMIATQTVQITTEPQKRPSSYCWCCPGYCMPYILLYTLNPLAQIPLLVRHDESGESVPMCIENKQLSVYFVVYDSIRNLTQLKNKLYIQYFFVLGARNTYIYKLICMFYITRYIYQTRKTH